MGKRLILVLALALVVGLTFSAAYAEVQNVKVSGDIIASGVARNHFTLNAATPGDKSVTKETFLMSQVRLRVDADLTDNVSATVRLINERIWNGQNDTSSSGDNAIDLDLAYVTLKEFLYSPLSLTVGRQEIKFGNGLIIGKSGATSNETNIPTDLSERRAFDAIRATLNYDPLVVDLIYAQVRQTSTTDRNTISLTGVNATYALNKKVDLSAYYFLKKDNYKAGSNGRGKEDDVNTIGGLISSTPIENLTASLEGAFQWGRADSATVSQNQHQSWAWLAMADYTFAKVKTTPKIGASWTYLSGNKDPNGSKAQGWDPMFYDQALNNITYAILPFSNMNVFNIKGSMKPVEDVTLAANFGYYDVAKESTGGTFTSPSDSGTSFTYTGKTHLGEALDLTATYDYTEDVQFSLTGGMFNSGDAITISSDRSMATQLIGSMKVTF
jgi:hypothetical protein